VPHYWILHQFNPNKEEEVMGEIVPPWEDIFDICYDKNEHILADRLHDADAFDVPIEFHEKDCLEICLYNNTERKSIFYFKRKKDKWRSTHLKPFELKNEYDQIKRGKVKE
jgi:hypothetical protein